jgi:hypothetical protein
VDSFKPRPLYCRGKGLRYPLDRMLNGPQNRSGRRGEEKILDPTGTRTPTPRLSSPQPVAIPSLTHRIGSLIESMKYSEKCQFVITSLTELISFKNGLVAVSL